MKNIDVKALAVVGLGLLIPALAARATRSLAGHGYKAITNTNPPRNPAHPDVEWKDAIAWTLVSGMVGGLARLFARRLLVETDVPAEGHDLEQEADRAI